MFRSPSGSCSDGVYSPCKRSGDGVPVPVLMWGAGGMRLSFYIELELLTRPFNVVSRFEAINSNR